MSQYTPGPWTVGEDEGTSKAHEILRKGHVVAWTCSHDPYEEGNARLIAAAPEMLDFISTDLMNFWPDKVQAHPDVKILLAKARALLARIEGRDEP